ncbi:hypothetical protein CcaCcLH18_13135 [Colletotrichum camelliae]|nr:hypothetical protein CcaCcLH18_13135 [Colletotrichum camelliae]
MAPRRVPDIDETLTFVPGPDHNAWRAKVTPSFDHTPRYLFRVWSPHNSMGTTGIYYVSSPLADSDSLNRHRNLLDQPAKEAAENLNRHLRWKTSYETKTNLVSWTSSLLFAIQYALYKWQQDKRTRVRILMVDTAPYPKGTFIRDLEAMRCLKNRSLPLKKLYNLRTGQNRYDFGEYLSQNIIRVTGNSGVIWLEKLIASDLTVPNICPYFDSEEDWSTLAKRVLRIRQEIMSLKASRGQKASLSQARTFIAVAEHLLGPYEADCPATQEVVEMCTGLPRDPCDTLVPAFAVMLMAISRFTGLEDNAMDAFLALYPELSTALRDPSVDWEENVFELNLFHTATKPLIKRAAHSQALQKYKQRAFDHMIGVSKGVAWNSVEQQEFVDVANDMYPTKMFVYNGDRAHEKAMRRW